MARRRRERFDLTKDYYLILGVSHTATNDEIQSAFRRRAKKLHPDRNPDSEATEQFQRLSEAYGVLSDAASRAEYDTLRETRRPWVRKYDVPRRSTGTIPRKRSGGRGVVAVLWNGPYRYVLVVLIIVILLNVALALATNQNQNPDVNAAQITPALVLGVPGTTQTPSPMFNTACSTADRFLSPANDAVLTSHGFTVAAEAQGVYQLDWSVVADDANTPDSLPWKRLTGASGFPPNRVLVDSAQMGTLVASLPRPSQIALRLTVLSAADQPVQQCEISVWLER